MATKPFSAYQGDQPCFFVCYAHSDDELVFPEMSWLDQAGYHLWYDEGIHVGAVWRRAIVDALDRARGLIFMCTSSAVVSENCIREINYALDENKPVIVVHLDDSGLSGELRLGLSDRQALVRSAFAESDYRRRLREALDHVLTDATVLRRLPKGSALSQSVTRETTSVPCVAVFPFSNLSGPDCPEYFSDGITDELINALAQVDGLQVVSRTSVFAFKGEPIDVRSFGRQLNATAVLEGSVRSSDGQLRVTTQLTSVSDGTNIWSSRYDREFKDNFTIQDEIAKSIVEALEIRLQSGKTRSPSNGTSEAYDLYLKGRYNWNRQTGEGLQTALDCFEEAIQRDPQFGAAYAGIAFAHASLAFHGIVPAKAALTASRDAAKRALAIDYTLPDANIAMAMVILFLDLKREEGERYIRRAIELNPSSAQAYYFLAAFLTQRARFDQGRFAIRKAIELDPLNVLNHTAAGWTEYYAGNWDEAISHLEKALTIDPDYPEIQIALGSVCVQLDRHDEAVARVAGVLDAYGPDPLVLAFLGALYGLAGQSDRALDNLERLDQIATDRHVPATCHALVYLGLHDAEKAIECLQQGVRDRDAFLSWMNVLPFAQWLRGDKRFFRVLSDIGLTR
jgi:serine/threonine-protein kinase